MNQFCENNGISVKHRAPRTPTTGGLEERSNRSCKEDLQTLIASKASQVSNWWLFLREISYTKNIIYDTAIKTTPYEVIFGFKPFREVRSTENHISETVNAKS